MDTSSAAIDPSIGEPQQFVRGHGSAIADLILGLALDAWIVEPEALRNKVTMLAQATAHHHHQEKIRENRNHKATGWLPSADGPSCGLEAMDFNVINATLKDADVPFKMEPFETPVCHMAVAMVMDPAGNVVIIHKRNPGNPYLIGRFGVHGAPTLTLNRAVGAVGLRH